MNLELKTERVSIHGTKNQNVVRNMFPRFNHLFRFLQFISHFEMGSIDECWEWKNIGGVKGRGFSWPERGIALAPVASYIFFKGPIPKKTGKKKLCVCHTCDNPRCVNPNHLWLGTAKQNSQDMVKKGRQDFSGLMAPKLVKKEEAKVCALYATGKYTRQELARKFDVSWGTVSRVIQKRAWVGSVGSIQ